MLSPFPHFHDPYMKCLDSSYNPFTVGRGWVLHILLPEHESVAMCSVVWGVGTGGQDTSHFRERFPGHLCRVHIPMVPERCPKRVEDLTHRIVKMDTYPAAHGGFSNVWSCQLRRKRSPPKRVAVKAIRHMTASDEEFQVKRKAVERELKIWVRLEHPNVVPLYGITDGFGPLPAFVCPWADNGTLSEYLEKFGTQLDLKKRMMLLRDIADGLWYLHSRDVVHGDLSGSNVLITSNGRAWVSDFGLSTLLDTSVPGISFPGHIRWAAPELLDEGGESRPASQLASREADIYSFGSIMLQILTGKLPFHGIQRVAQIVIMISRGTRPSRELGWDGKAIPDVLWEFVEACWANPSDRPPCKDIISFIKHQLSRL